MLNLKEQRLCISILHWYAKHQRDLPWRHTRNPYKIFVSEVMLQQTQVDRVVPKYKAFLKRFPTIHRLLDAKISEVITAWKGFGYNRRALFLHRAANEIVSVHGGRFPHDLVLLKQLPGIGDYTARAILSFAFDEPVPVLDTNHRKFYQRTFFRGRKTSDKALLKKAEEVVGWLQRETPSLPPPTRGRKIVYSSPRRTIHHWNQALMDFMTAVEKSCSSDDPLIASYNRVYPKPRRKKSTGARVPFRDTDRYVRGRIIDLLREKKSERLANVEKMFSGLNNARFQRIIRALADDELIVIGKTRMRLP